MNNRNQLLNSLSEIIADYRKGEIAPRTPDLIEKWLLQFPAPLQAPLLEALVHVFGKTYVSRHAFKDFLRGLAATNKLTAGTNPAEFWRRANILSIQRGGNSQNEILAMFDEVLQEVHGLGIQDTGSENGDFIYLDDCIGTGTRVRNDICAWLAAAAPKKATLHVITPILYRGSWWIDGHIKQAATANGKTLNISKWRLDEFEMENRRTLRNKADVLWPTEIPDNPSVQAYTQYLKSLGYPPILREPGDSGASGIFKDDTQKILLEQAFLTRGCEIKDEKKNLSDRLRPLGYQNLASLGFGSMFVMYRNCPNNCPLVLWIDQAGHPALFPRKTNTETSDETFLKSLLGG